MGDYIIDFVSFLQADSFVTSAVVSIDVVNYQ